MAMKDGCSKSKVLTERRASIVDGLLYEIYDRCQRQHRCDSSFDSDTITEHSTSECNQSRRFDSLSVCSDQRSFSNRLNEEILFKRSIPELFEIFKKQEQRVAFISARLVRQLKRRDNRLVRLQKNCDVVTAFLQASSLKRKEDMNLKFTMEPKPGEDAFQQWREALRAVTRLPLGFPKELRRKVWLALADNYIERQSYDWPAIMKQAFNERCTPDDFTLDAQIVKDLHRTGCDRFCSEVDRAALKRVLLAYARWNKRVGYCQGFNVLAALILEVVNRKEEEALKLMMFLVDHVLPESYFAQNLQALSVDMAVFRDLLRIHQTTLAAHLDALQTKAAETNVTLSSTRGYEPPLTNVFTMQWFLTLFATCLPENAVLRVWDSVMLEGSEVMLRTALVIWEVIGSYVMKAHSADQFYELMRDLTEKMSLGDLITEDDLIHRIYILAPFPYSRITELRERYTYNITPFANAAASTIAVAAARTGGATKLIMNKNPVNHHYSLGTDEECDEDDFGDDNGLSIGCFPRLLSSSRHHTGSTGGAYSSLSADISTVGPGAVSSTHPEDNQIKNKPAPGAYQERMSTDLSALQRQYHRLKNRQRQAGLILSNNSTNSQATSVTAGRIEPGQKIGRRHNHIGINYSSIDQGPVINHLFFLHQTQISRSASSSGPPRTPPVPVVVAAASKEKVINSEIISSSKPVQYTNQCISKKRRDCYSAQTSPTSLQRRHVFLFPPDPLTNNESETTSTTCLHQNVHQHTTKSGLNEDNFEQQSLLELSFPSVEESSVDSPSSPDSSSSCINKRHALPTTTNAATTINNKEQITKTKQKTLLQVVTEARKANKVISEMCDDGSAAVERTTVNNIHLQAPILDITDRIRAHHERLANASSSEIITTPSSLANKQQRQLMHLPHEDIPHDSTAQWVERLHIATGSLIVQPSLPLALHSFYRQPSSSQMSTTTQSSSIKDEILIKKSANDSNNCKTGPNSIASSSQLSIIHPASSTISSNNKKSLTKNPFPKRSHFLTKNRLKFGSQFGLYKSISQQNKLIEES